MFYLLYGHELRETKVTVLQEAYKYVENYGWSVIPIWYPSDEHDGKRPAVADSWLAYTQRRPTLDELEAWFENRQKNLAIVCGSVSDNLVVIDCDDEKTYFALCFAYPELRKSLTVATGKGWHIYTFADQEVRTAVFRLNGMTHHIKAEGSYVIAPPSVHKTGRIYQWRDPDVPPIYLDLEKLQRALKSIGAEGRGSDPDGTRNPPGWAAQLILEGAREGGRDDLTTKLAGHLTYAYPDGLPVDTVAAILEIWAERCDQPWGANDTDAKLRSVLRGRQR